MPPPVKLRVAVVPGVAGWSRVTRRPPLPQAKVSKGRAPSGPKLALPAGGGPAHAIVGLRQRGAVDGLGRGGIGGRGKASRRTVADQLVARHSGIFGDRAVIALAGQQAERGDERE